MSRTYRRHKKDLIRNYCGPFDEFEKDVQWNDWRHGGHDRAAYKRFVHWYTRDHHSGIWNVPSWVVSRFLNRIEGHAAKTEIQRCLLNGTFEDHLDPKFKNSSAWIWW